MNKFKNLDRIIKKRILYASIVIFVLVMINITLSYSYYLGKVVGNESSTTLSFTSTGILVQFDNNSSSITAENIMSGWSTTKNFSISSSIAENDFTNNQTKLWYEIFLYVDNNTFPTNIITYTLTPSDTIYGNGITASARNNVGISTGNNTEGISLGLGYFTVGDNVHTYDLVLNYVDNNSEYGNYPDSTLALHIGAKVITNSTVILDLDGGSIEGDSVLFASKNGKIVLEKPAKHRYVFSGWEKVEGEGEISGNEVTVNSDVLKLKANWEKRDNNLLLFLDLNGGTTTDERYRVVPFDSTIALTTPTKAYHDFVGWGLITEDNATIDGNNITVRDTDVIVEAQWEFSKVKLTIDVNGGTTIQDVVSGVQMNSTITLVEPTRSGYVFSGWEVSSGSGIINGDKLTIGTEDVTVRAKWTIVYTVSFDSAGGTGVAPQSVVYNNPATQPSNPTRTGYIFQGWTLDGTLFNFNTKITSNITLVASWQIITYTVTFDSNGGSTVSPQTVNYNSTATQPSNPTKSGYIFKGWTLNGSSYNFGSIVTSNITLVASWESVVPAFTYSGKYQLINDTANNWRIKFLTSGTLKFTKLGNATSGIDVFLVGGGGGSAVTKYGGGGGGYTGTYKNVYINTTSSYTITIGAGGVGGNSGGKTSAFEKSVNGGNPSNGWNGGNGGSGGGGGCSNCPAASGGSNGGSGGGSYNDSGNKVSNGGTGQGTTTREFGESSGTLYAGGGGGVVGHDWGVGSGGSGGGAKGRSSAAANTGGGGGGSAETSYNGTATNGGSGIVVIRNKR